jgi:aerobic carbon-monoxide dehydrogenase large subunit
MSAFQKFGIGQPVRRKEDQRLLIGGGRFTDDINLDGQVHAAFLRSSYAHALIKNIDVGATRAAPGVVAVYIGQDLAAAQIGRLETEADLTDRHGKPLFKTQRLALPVDKLRYVGEPVVLVVAETAWQAKDAVERIRLDIEELPVVVTAAAALAADAPVLHDEKGDNLCLHWEKNRPADYDAVAARAHKIVTIELINNRVVPVPLEPRGCLADYSAATGRLTVYAPSQGGRRIQRALSRILFAGDGSRVRMVSHDTGGGFGARSKTYAETVALSFASKTLGRPVKWLGDRSETFLSDTHGRDQVNQAELAFDAGWRIIGYRLETLLNLGAFASDVGPRIPIASAGKIVGGAYEIPLLYYSCKAVLTNTVPTDAYRGAGQPEANYLLERLLEKAAIENGLDSHELRRRNYMTHFPYTTQMGVTVDTGDFAACQAMARKLHDWDGFASRRAGSQKRGLLRGIGLASFLEGAGGPPREEMRVRLEPDGTASIFCGTFSHGQGHATVYSQLLADKLGVPFDAVNLVQGDTDQAPPGAGGTVASRSSQMGTIAILRAVNRLLEKGGKIAAHLLQSDPSEVTFDPAASEFKASAGSVSLAEVVKTSYRADRLPDGITPGMDESYDYTRPNNSDNFPNGSHVCEVEVDPETGKIDIVAYTAIDDCGTVMNPLIVDGQVHGGVAQGIGQAMTENLVYDEETGQMLTGSFMDYGMPRAHHLPHLRTAFCPTPSTTNELGVKGAGEGGCVVAPSALVIAVLHALRPLGVAHLDMPLTPERVWRAIQMAKETADS